VQPAYGVTFGVSAAIAVLAAIMMITRRNAVHSAVWLAVCFSAIGVLYLTLQAPFIAVLQITIYAGAIMVLFLFVVMLLNVAAPEGRDPLRVIAGLGIVLGGVFTTGLGLAFACVTTSADDAALARTEGTVEEVGKVLFADYVFAFEFVSVLLVAAMVGVIVLGVRRRERGPSGSEGGR